MAQSNNQEEIKHQNAENSKNIYSIVKNRTCNSKPAVKHFRY